MIWERSTVKSAEEMLKWCLLFSILNWGIFFQGLQLMGCFCFVLKGLTLDKESRGSWDTTCKDTNKVLRRISQVYKFFTWNNDFQPLLLAWYNRPTMQPALKGLLRAIALFQTRKGIFSFLIRGRYHNTFPNLNTSLFAHWSRHCALKLEDTLPYLCMSDWVQNGLHFVGLLTSHVDIILPDFHIVINLCIVCQQYCL